MNQLADVFAIQKRITECSLDMNKVIELALEFNDRSRQREVREQLLVIAKRYKLEMTDNTAFKTQKILKMIREKILELNSDITQLLEPEND